MDANDIDMTLPIPLYVEPSLEANYRSRHDGSEKKFCKCLFPLLDAVVEHGGQKEDIYLNRYPGFLSERLLSYFFEKNRDKYRLVYADKNFMA